MVEIKYERFKIKDFTHVSRINGEVDDYSLQTIVADPDGSFGQSAIGSRGSTLFARARLCILRLSLRALVSALVPPSKLGRTSMQIVGQPP